MNLQKQFNMEIMQQIKFYAYINPKRTTIVPIYRIIVKNQLISNFFTIDSAKPTKVECETLTYRGATAPDSHQHAHA